MLLEGLILTTTDVKVKSFCCDRAMDGHLNKSIIFQLFARVATCILKALQYCEGMPKIIVVSALISIMKNEVKQLKDWGSRLQP